MGHDDRDSGLSLSSSDSVVSGDAFVEILDGRSWFHTEFIVKNRGALLILAQGQAALPLTQVATHQSVVGFFEASIEGQQPLPLVGALAEVFPLPGKVS